MGRPKTGTELDQVAKRLADAFDALGPAYATRDDFSKITKVIIPAST
jgi:hypothetical protein